MTPHINTTALQQTASQGKSDNLRQLIKKKAARLTQTVARKAANPRKKDEQEKGEKTGRVREPSYTTNAKLRCP
jgi:hypothetical protein